jgi:tetratricopeptide (TPR) repeat protein
LELWQRLADSYARIGRPKKAADIYAKLIASAAPSAVVNQLRGELANLYLQLQDHTNAVKQLQAIVRENPERYPRAWYALGRLAYEDGKLSDAADDFENALHGDPTLESAYFELALVQADLHRTGEALHTVDRAHNFFANNFEGEFVTALVYSHTQNYAEAVRHFTAAEVIGLASKSNRLDQRFYFPFGAACERNGQFDQAAQYLQKCIDLSPDFSEALNYLGYMWADRGQNLAKARDLIEKAVKLDPKNGAYLDSLGWVLFKQKQPAQALPWLLKAMQYSTKPDPTVLDHLGEVYMALGQPDKAREAWKKSLLLESNEQIKKKLEASSAPAS